MSQRSTPTRSQRSPQPHTGKIEIARVYDEVGQDPSRRILVDRLWPRGLAKSKAPFAVWAKDVAPSTELRKWYDHAEERFDEFARRFDLLNSYSTTGVRPDCDFFLWKITERFDEFARRYHDELTRPPSLEALEVLREQIGGGDAVLLTATKVLAYSHASELREVLARP